jgi:acyl-CoA synthetase (AMP-forming)/AMP-acid ligase II
LLTSLPQGAIEDIGLGVRWDCATLADEVERRARALAQCGIGRPAVVAIAHGGTARFFADLLATWRLGATAACLDPALTAHERTTLLAFLRPAIVLVDEAAVATAGWRQAALGDLASGNGVTAGIAADPSDPALILFTSGTTGTPKGVVLSFGAILERIRLNVGVIGKPTLARVLVTLPTSFGHGLIGNALTPLLSGGTIVLPRRGLPLAQTLGQLIDDHRITFLSSVPALWRLALKLGRPQEGASLLRVHVGSAPMPTQLWRDVVAWSRAEVVNCYGMTETANWFAGASSRDGIADGLVGKPWGGEAVVLNDDGVREASGEGEILVRSSCLMSGYLDRPELTAAAMQDGWFRTGDRGSIDRDGRIRLTGRIKEEINRAGLKVQPAEVDAMLENHPAVMEACAFGIDDAISGELVAVAVRLAPGATETAESLRQWCRQRVRHELVPERWFLVDEIPRTIRGKLDRDAVRRLLTGASHAQ